MPGADDEVLHGARDEHLARAGERRDARAEMDGQPGDVVRQDLDLADVDAGPDLEPELPDAVADRDRAADRAGRAVERREEPVADDLDLVAAEPLELATDDAVVVGEQGLPADVAELGRPLGRADDVGEQDGRQHASRLGRRPDAGDERLDLGDHRVLVAGPDEVVDARAARRTGRRGCARAR